MKLILIRHALTDDNLKRRYCGFRDIGLSRIGKLKAGDIKRRLKGFKIDRIYCSDLKRSWQTADIIFGSNNAKIKNPSLREMNFGKWEGLNFRQAQKRYPNLYKRWLKNPLAVNIPGGEKTSHFIRRIKRVFKSITNNNSHKTIVIVGHLGPMRIMLNTILGLKSKDFWKLDFNPKALYVIEYKTNSKSQINKL